MSRIQKKPVEIPSGVEVKIDGQDITAKGPKGELALSIHQSVGLFRDGDILTVKSANDDSGALAGTMRALLNNVILGVTQGFQKKLTLVGVGYRAQVKDKVLNLTLGFSHPVVYAIPDGIVIETPSQTEIIISGADKQKVGQVAAVIRSYRPPEPYKGKGVRYSDEHVARKEAKKT